MTVKKILLMNLKKKFPEDADVFVTELKHTNGYHRLKYIGGVKV